MQQIDAERQGPQRLRIVEECTVFLFLAIQYEFLEADCMVIYL